MHNSSLFDLWDLTLSGQIVHHCPGLFNYLVDHDCLGEGLLDGAHLDFSLKFSVFHFAKHSLELRLLLVGVLVLNGLGLVRDVFLCRGSGAWCLSFLSAGHESWPVEDLLEVGKIGCGFVYDLFPAP